MKIAVIGGSGFIGQQIVTSLGSEKFEVMSLHRNSHNNSNHRVSKFDLFNPTESINILTLYQPDVVIVTAWITELATYKNSPINERYALAIEDLARKLEANLKFHLIVLGSSAEYGLEEGPCASNITKVIAYDSYSKAKIGCLQRLGEMFADSASRLTWIRVFQPYGANQDSSRLIPSAIKHFKENKIFSLQSPSSISDWISSRDIASAIKFCVSNQTPQIVDLGTGIPTSNADLLELLRFKMGVSDRLVNLGEELKYTSRYLDITNSSLHGAGWIPRDNLASGLDWVLESCE